MTGKYRSWPGYLAAKVRGELTRRRIDQLVQWAPIQQPTSGYSIVIGCNTPLAQMLGANLNMLQRQRLDHLDRVIIVFDTPRRRIPGDIETEARGAFPRLPLEFVYYTDDQVCQCARLNHPWINCWLSWCLGLAAAPSRYCLLHDFDAMLIRPDIIEQRYRAIRGQGTQYCGVRNYVGNGITASDGLLVTFEMLFDLEFVRRHFAPIDLFNKVGTYRGRRVEFDTFLYPQTKAGQGFILEIPESDMVHPSQVICQFEQLRRWRGFIPPERNNLLMIPYFLYLGGKTQMMHDTTRDLRQATRRRSSGIEFFGQTMNLSRLSAQHAQWISKQAFQLDCAVAQTVRSDVAEYFSSIADFVNGNARWIDTPDSSRVSPGDNQCIVVGTMRDFR